MVQYSSINWVLTVRSALVRAVLTRSLHEAYYRRLKCGEWKRCVSYGVLLPVFMRL